jgi:hypothetical protein
MNIKEKIQAALDSLEMKMKSQAHLKEDRYESVIEDVDFLLKCWSALNEDDREFLGAAKFAIKAQMRWE